MLTVTVPRHVPEPRLRAFRAAQCLDTPGKALLRGEAQRLVLAEHLHITHANCRIQLLLEHPCTLARFIGRLHRRCLHTDLARVR